jgi:hypothetical protein
MKIVTSYRGGGGTMQCHSGPKITQLSVTYYLNDPLKQNNSNNLNVLFPFSQ